MKYIDAEKLVDKIWEICDYASEHWDVEEERGAYNFAKRLTDFIDSLQQDKDVLDLCSQVWWEHRGWIMIPPNVTLKGIESLLERVRHKIKWNEEKGIEEQEQPEVDLEKEMDKWLDAEPHTVRDTARHFYELGLNARK